MAASSFKLAVQSQRQNFNISSNGKRPLLNQLSCLYESLKCYCTKKKYASEHESFFVKNHSLESLELKHKLLGLPPSPPRAKINYEEVKVDWKFVERLLPPAKVPEFPKFAKYPSGWQPPDLEKTKDLPYHVRRCRDLQLPVYFQSKNGHTRHLTKVGYIEGDIWALEKDLRSYLEKISGVPVPTQIHEVANFIRFRGDYFKEISFWLMDKGF